jgi:hypothetical protein
VARVGRTFPLSGFFYTGPERDTLFHQFHRATDQAPVVALAAAGRDLPRASRLDAVVRRGRAPRRVPEAGGDEDGPPYGVLPAYVYRLADSLTVPDSGGRYLATRDAYAAQVRAGTPMGDGWYLRAFPVWFQRRGNYGVLLSQAKGPVGRLAAARRRRGDGARAAAGAVGGRAQSVRPEHDVRRGPRLGAAVQRLVGRLRGLAASRACRAAARATCRTGPRRTCTCTKEVWVHPSIRWLWLMADLLGDAPASGAATPSDFTLATTSADADRVVLRVTTRHAGAHRYALRADNLRVDGAPRAVTVRAGQPATLEWTARRVRSDAPWTAVVIEDGDVDRRRELFGH